MSFEHAGERHRGEAEDLSQRGAFVRTDKQLEVGDEVELELELPQGTQLALRARVAHRLEPRSAGALARSPGMGFVFLEHDEATRAKLASFLGRITIEVISAPAPDVRGAYFVIAHKSAPLARRIGNILDEIGCEHQSASDAVGAFDACQGRRPDCVIADLELPGGGGLGLLGLLAESFDLVDVPVVLLAEDATPIERLRAYRLGVADFIEAPYIDEEVSIRLRRAVAFGLQSFDTAILRTRLADLKLSTLLSMLELENKTGVVTVRSSTALGRVFLHEGRLVRAELGELESGAALAAMLAWPAGEAEFVAMPVIVPDEAGGPLVSRRDTGDASSKH